MRIARFALAGDISYGLVHGDGEDPADLTVATLVGHPLFDPTPTGDVLPLSSVRLLAPVQPINVVCIGKNYADHVAEMKDADRAAARRATRSCSSSRRPRSSARATRCGCRATASGSTTRPSSPSSSASPPATSRRSRRSTTSGATPPPTTSPPATTRSRDGQWTRGKGHDTFCPLGPWLETDLDVADAGVQCSVDGELRQDGNTRDLLHDVPGVLAFITSFMTLLPGRRRAHRHARRRRAAAWPATRVSVRVQGIGTLTNPVPVGADEPVRVGRCASASPPARPATRTSAPPTCRCSTSPSRASRAGSSCCGSRTPTAPASGPTASSRSTTRSRWLGLDWDEGPDKGGPCAPYRQSERLDTYRPFVDQLLAQGDAYLCWCSGERLTQMREEQQKAKQPTGYDRLCLGKTAQERAALPGLPGDAGGAAAGAGGRRRCGSSTSSAGEVSAPHPDDQVLLKGDGFPTYHLAVVVDDHLMGITHVVRGEEWISSTPKHLLLFDMLGWERPQFAHMPLLRNVDKSKISKRKNPAARLTWFQEQGYLPEALLNFLGLLGYSQPDGAEVFSFADMSRDFDWARVNTVGPVFDLDKLRLAQRPLPARAGPRPTSPPRLVPFLAGRRARGRPADGRAGSPTFAGLVPLVQTRFALLSEAPALCRFLLVDEDAFGLDEDARGQAPRGGVGGRPRAPPPTRSRASTTGRRETVQAAMDAALLEGGLGLKRGKAYAPVRVAVTGRGDQPAAAGVDGAARAGADAAPAPGGDPLEFSAPTPPRGVPWGMG